MDGEWNNMKDQLKGVLKKGAKIVSIIILIVIIVVFILSAAVYFLTIDDGTYKEGDWSSTNYGAKVYTDGVSLNSDGTLSCDMTAQELWDKMIENGSRVDEYLDSPEELARLMKAEIVTQYPDTRPNPDEPIDWEKIVKNEDSLQGIIKFKRANAENKTSTMIYADPETFQGYIDEYNSTGSETAKKNALTHFTLTRSSVATASGNGATAVAAGEGVMTDVSQDIIDAINNTPWPGEDLCLHWVNDVYENAGLSVDRKASAYDSYLANCISTDKTAIPIGAAVFGTGSGTAGGKYGHVGIYIGDGKVVDSISTGIKTSTLEEWISWQENYERNSNNVLTDLNGNEQHGWLGWGWVDGNRIRGTTQDSNVTQNNSNDTKKDETTIETAVERNVLGDGYSQEYTSSAGITYKQYKQYAGSYSNNAYWGGTIAHDGCGPTSIAILASGLTNLNYTPGDIAANMNSTSYETLKQEMEALGMSAEVVQNPSAETIQNNLRNGKVMLVSVNSNTEFTSNSHIMAIVDINTNGEVYICNPGSSSKYGWYDVSEITKGCKYIVITEAGAAGIANVTNNSEYVAIVATWRQIDTTITTDDPDVEATSTTQYFMTTTPINYEAMVESYTMPFDLLWAFLVVGEEKEFVFELADLVYNSDIQITIYDNLTVNTDIDNWHYTKSTKAVVDYDIIAKYQEVRASKAVNDDTHDPYEEIDYNTVKTVVTQTNTLSAALTRANVWIVDYVNEYAYVNPESESRSETIKIQDQEYPSEPDSTGTSFNCEHIESTKQTLAELIIDKYIQSQVKDTPDSNELMLPTDTVIPSESDVTYIESYNVEYYSRYVEITDEVTNKVKTQKYTKKIAEPPKEKTDKDSEEPNFVTIYNKPEHSKARKNIESVESWLFEILEINDSTTDMLDLIKYLLYKATGNDYGVESFDFNAAFSPKSLITVGAGDYIVNIDMSSSDIVITDLNTLKQAFSGYSGDSQLQKYAEYFLKYQEEYRVNAVFAAAVSISETGAGRDGHAVDGKNNWFNIECTCGNSSHGRFETYSSVEKSIERFFWQIANGSYYFTQGNYTVSSIGIIYCENADAPGGWIDSTNTYMTQMFKGAGISPSSESESTEKGDKIVNSAKSKIGCDYVWGAEGPDTFDCSGLARWCYKQVGIDIPHNSEDQKNSAIKKVQVSEARVGDVLWKSGHVAIYIGNGQLIEAPGTGQKVKISNNINIYTYALQFY